MTTQFPGAGPTSAEVTGLVSAMNHAAAMTQTYENYAAMGDTFVAGLAGGEVSGEAVAAAHRAREAEQLAADHWSACHHALAEQLTVTEAYTATPGAGSKRFVTGDTGSGTGSPATPSSHSDDVRTAMTASPDTPAPAATTTDVRAAAAPLPDTAGLGESSSKNWHGSDVVAAGDGQVYVGRYQPPGIGAYVVVSTRPAGTAWEPESVDNGIDPSLNTKEAGRLADALDDLAALAQSGTAAPAPTKLDKLAARVRALLGTSSVTIIGDQGEIEVSAADLRQLLDAAAPEPAVTTRRRTDAKACGKDDMDTGTVWAELDTSGPEPVIAVTTTEGETPEDHPEGYTTTRLSPAQAAELAATVRRFAGITTQATRMTAQPAPPAQAATVPAPRAEAAPAGPRRITNPRGQTYEYDPDTGATAVIEPDGGRAVVPASSPTGTAARLLWWNAEIKDGRGNDATDDAARALLDRMTATQLREVAEAVGLSAPGARTKTQLIAAIVNTAIGAARKYRGLSKW